MGTTPNLNLPYPELTDSPDVPRDIKALALAVEAKLPRIATGHVSAPGTADGAATITFPAGRFTTAPRIALGVTPFPGNNIVYDFDQVTATGFRVLAYNATNGVGTGVPVSCDWIAVQDTP
jgi:hypothetical protein